MDAPLTLFEIRGFVAEKLKYLGVRSADVDDVTQHVLLAVAQAAGANGSAKKGWIYGICRHKAADYHRSRGRVEGRLDRTVPADELSSPQPPADTVARREFWDWLAHALTKLPNELRVVFVMHDMNEQPMPAVASAIKTNAHTAWSRLRLARETLAERYRQAHGHEKPIGTFIVVAGNPFHLVDPSTRPVSTALDAIVRQIHAQLGERASLLGARSSGSSQSPTANPWRDAMCSSSVRRTLGLAATGAVLLTIALWQPSVEKAPTTRTSASPDTVASAMPSARAPSSTLQEQIPPRVGTRRLGTHIPTNGLALGVPSFGKVAIPAGIEYQGYGFVDGVRRDPFLKLLESSMHRPGNARFDRTISIPMSGAYGLSFYVAAPANTYRCLWCAVNDAAKFTKWEGEPISRDEWRWETLKEGDTQTRGYARFQFSTGNHKVTFASCSPGLQIGGFYLTAGGEPPQGTARAPWTSP